MTADFILPHWSAPAKVRALQTTRKGGTSRPPYESFNLGDHVGDDEAAVAANRARLRRHLPADPCWLRQIHGVTVAEASVCGAFPEADAVIARQPGQVCAVMTADCLPILLCDRRGSVAAAVHAGWRGLAAGVVERAVDAMAAPPEELLAWLGPAIGPMAFEVGDEVRAAFVTADAAAEQTFVPHGPGKWRADLYALARLRLRRRGVTAVFGGEFCTHGDARFFSYRRDGVTGRMASLIWLEAAEGG